MSPYQHLQRIRARSRRRAFVRWLVACLVVLVVVGLPLLGFLRTP